MSSKPLLAPLRLGLVFVNVLVGLVPSLAFYAWIERNSSLPWIGLQLGWPWADLQAWPVPALAAWDFALILMFGALHTATAQPGFHRLLERWVPIQAIRTIYVALTGACLLGVMGLWQNTGIVLWLLPLGQRALNLLSLGLFWGFIACALTALSHLAAFEFIGLKQLYQSGRALQSQRSAGMPELVTRGAYRWVRHPLYLFTLLAFAVTPFMTLDRAVVTTASMLYLAFAIPVEERKLVALFGRQYVDYRSRVPAIIPRRPV